jgi:Zn-dependent M28 family amino/carboxypeptidase
MLKLILPMLALLLTTLAHTALAAEAPDPELQAVAEAVSPAALGDTIATLVGFGTRHTMSDTTSPTRGIGAARRWAAGRFERFSKACGGCILIQTPQQTVTGARIPNPTVIQDILAIQKGDVDPGRVVIISGHIDSRVTDVMNAVADAPGANDDGSGVAAVIEAALVLSKHKLPATIVYAVLSGEEQGLYGGKVLADYAKAQGWRVEAVLNNDIVGNIHGMDGKVVSDMVRVFSEGTRPGETEKDAAQRRRTGGELDAPSRNLSRYLAGIADDYVPGFKVRMIYRADRFGRGGDQEPMQDAGFPAVRLTEADENYTRQHQDVRLEKGVQYGDVASGVDLPYLAEVTRLNAVALASLALAPPPPTGVKIAGAVTADTTLSWNPAPGAHAYKVWWRETTAPRWEHSQLVRSGTTATLTGVNIDDFFFGVSSVGVRGLESPVEFPGAAGSF